MKSRILSALFALYIAWGTTYLAIHYAIQSIPPFFMSGMRFLVAGLILYIWRRIAGDPAPKRVQWRNAAILGNLLLVGGIGGVSLAEKYVPSGISALIVAATPLWVVVIDGLRPKGNHPTWQTMAGVLVGLGGIFILIDPMKAHGNEPGFSLLGIGILLVAGISWAIGSIYSHGVDMPNSPLLGSGMELLTGSAGSFLVGLILGEGRQLNLAGISFSSWGGLGYLIVVGSLVGFVCYTWLLRVAPIQLVVTYAYVNPLVAVVLGSWLAHEVVNARVLIATPLILLAVGMSHIKPREKKVTEAGGVMIGESAGED